MTISTQRLRLLRGNSSAVAAFTGLQGEVVFNTDTYTLHLQDGVTAGGYSLATAAQVANISSNANYSNANVSSYLASNSNVAITTTANIKTNANLLVEQYVASNVLLIGGAASAEQHSLIISNVGNAVKFITGNRTNGNISIQIQANNSLSGIYLRNDTGAIGFNTIPQGGNVGYTFTFNGDMYANNYYAAPNVPRGYQFAVPSGNTGMSHIYNFPDPGSYINIQHDDIDAAKFYDNNTTELRGNIVVSDGVHYGQYPDAYLQIYGFANSYQQLVLQNLSSNGAASSDIVATADNGTDTTYYINMGINSSTFASNSWFPGSSTVNDGYLYVVGSNITGPSAGNIANLIIGSTNGLVKTFIGNTAEANVVTVVDSTGLLPGANVTYNLGSATRQWKDLWVSNNTIYIGGVALGMTAGNVLTVNGNAVLSNNSNTAVTTTGNISAGNVLTGGTVSATGNITANYFIGNGSQLTGIAATYGNANVVANLAAFGFNPISTTGNITTTANISGAYVKGNGSELTSLPAPTVTQDISSNGAMSIMTYDGTIKYVNYATVEPSSGNIAGGNINTTGNVTANSFIGLLGSITNLDSLNFSVENISALVGNNGVNIGAGGYNNLVVLPTEVLIQNVPLNTTGNISANYFIGDGSQLTNLPGGGGNTANVTFSDQVVIGTGTNDGGGGLYLAPGPDSVANSAVQYLRVRGGDYITHIHLDTGNNAYYDQYFGADSKYVKLEANGNIVINADDGANSATWTFGLAGAYGELTLPAGEGIIKALDDTIALVSLNTTTGNANSVYLGSGGGLGFNDQEIGGNWLEIFRSGTEPEIRVPVGRGNLNIQTAEGENVYNWTFDNTGLLNLPGSLSTPSNITVNDTLFVVGSIQPTGASPAPYLSGFSSISTVISGNANEGNITAHNYLRANGGIITTGNITGNTAGFVIGYRDIPQVVFTSNATLALTDAGKHYYSANSANIITVPNNATVSFDIGTAISIVQQGTANLTVTPASGVTMYLAGNSTSASRTVGNYGMATLMKVATNTWFINGTGVN